MKSKSPNTAVLAFEDGMLSITGLLSDLANDTKNIFKFLDENNSSESISLSLTNINKLLTSYEKVVGLKTKLLKSIAINLKSLVEHFTGKKVKPESFEFDDSKKKKDEPLTIKSLSDAIKNFKAPEIPNFDLSKSISEGFKNIRLDSPNEEKMEIPKFDLKSMLGMTKSLSKLDETNIKLLESVKSIINILKNWKTKESDEKGKPIKTTYFGDFIKSISTMKDLFSDKLLKNFNKFNSLMEKLLLVFKGNRIKTYSKNLVIFSKSLTTFGKALEPISEFLKSLGKTMLIFTGSLAILILSLFAISEVPFSGIVKLITFIGLLGITLNMFYGKKGFFGGVRTAPPSILGFASGVGILVLSLIVLDSVDWTAPLKLIGFIALLGLVLNMVDKRGGIGKPGTITGFAFGISILVLAMFAIQEIEWTSVFKMVAFVAMLGLALKLHDTKSGPDIIKFAIGIGVLTLSMWIMKELPVETMFKMVAFVAGMGIALKLVDQKAAGSMLLLAGSLMLIAGALALVAVSPITLEKTLIFGGSILFLAGVAIGLGVPVVAGFALLGTVVMVALALGSVLVAGSLAIVSLMEIDIKKIFNFIGAVGLIAAGFALLTPVAAIAVVSSILLLPLAITSVIMAAALKSINGVEVDGITAFIKSVGILTIGYSLLIPFAAVSMIGASLLIPTMKVSILIANVLKEISKIEINQKNIDNFEFGLNGVIKSYSEIGIIEAGKTSAKAMVLLPALAAGMFTALTLSAISKLNISESKIESFSKLNNLFIQSISNTINGNIKELKNIQPGLKALADLISVASKLSEVVVAFSNMNYNIYEVKNGKLEIVGTRKITDKEIEQVGINVGKLIQSLVVPLEILSSNSDSWNFGGGLTIKNPFKRSSRGIKNIGKLGTALLPLSEAVSKFSNTSFLQNKADLDKFKLGLITIIDTFTDTFIKLENWKNDEAETSINNIEKLVDSFEKYIDSDKLNSINDVMKSLIDNLSDADKWDRINNNFINLNKNLKDIVNNINALNLEKALVLERNLKILSESSTNQALKEIIEKLKELIDGIVEKQNPQVIVESQRVEQQKFETKVADSNTLGTIGEELKEILVEIATKVGITNDKLGGKLKVLPVGSSSNSL